MSSSLRKSYAEAETTIASGDLAPQPLVVLHLELVRATRRATPLCDALTEARKAIAADPKDSSAHFNAALMMRSWVSSKALHKSIWK